MNQVTLPWANNLLSNESEIYIKDYDIKRAFEDLIESGVRLAEAVELLSEAVHKRGVHTLNNMRNRAHEQIWKDNLLIL